MGMGVPGGGGVRLWGGAGARRPARMIF